MSTLRNISRDIDYRRSVEEGMRREYITSKLVREVFIYLLFFHASHSHR